MKKILTFALALISFLFVGASFLDVEASYPNVIVTVTGVIEGNNNAAVTTYGSRVYRSQVTVNPTLEGQTFAFWIVNGVVKLGVPQETSFTVTSSLQLQVVFRPTAGNKSAVVFIDVNGRFLGADFVTNGQAADDSGINLPVRPGYEVVEGPDRWVKVHGSDNLNSINQDSVFVLQYQSDLSIDDVNLTVNNGLGTGAYTFNSIVTLEPTVPGATFSHYEENGVIVSYKEDYKFTALYDRELTAVNQTTPEVKEPLVTLSKDLELRSGYHTYVAQFELPDGYSLVEYGFLFSQSANILTRANSTVARSTNYNETTNEYITSFPVGSHLAMRAYLVVEQDSNPGVFIDVVSKVNHRYLQELKFNFDFTGTTKDTLGYDAGIFSLNNLVTSSNFLANSIEVQHTTSSTAPHTNMGRFLVTRSRVANSSLELNFGQQITSISFDFAIWSNADFGRIGEMTSYELQEWNAVSEQWVAIGNLLPIIVNSTQYFNVSFNTNGGSLFRFYAVQNGGTGDVRFAIDNLKAYSLFKGIVHDVTYNNDNVITTELVADGHKALGFTPTKTGYTFLGWYDNPELTGPIYDFNTPVTTNFTLYAKWELVTYNITYNGLEGASNSNTATYNVETPTINLSDPGLREGYLFAGWFTAAEGGVEVEEIVLGSTGNVVLFARWNLVSYDITYNGLEGASNSNPATYNVETPTITLADPGLRDGYDFVGWFTAAEGGTEVESITLGTTGDVIVFARWEELAAGTVLVSYEAFDGTPAPSPMTVNVDEPFSAPTAPTKTGYTFGGWYKENTFVTIWNFAVDTTDVAITLYAKWNVITYDITYLNLEGATNNNPTSYNIETPTITLEKPGLRTGFAFVGWFDDEVGGTKISQIPQNSSVNYDLYARWLVETTLMIYEVYGGGGNSGSLYKDDYIVLYNGTNSSINLSGYSVQYASATGSTWTATNLSGTIDSLGFYVVKQARGAGGTVDLPRIDATGTIAMAATNVKVALVNTTTLLTGTNPSSDITVIDFIGTGTANGFEGTVAPTMTNTSSAQRKNFTDTNNNFNDFAIVDNTTTGHLDYVNP